MDTLVLVALIIDGVVILAELVILIFMIRHIDKLRDYIKELDDHLDKLRTYVRHLDK